MADHFSLFPLTNKDLIDSAPSVPPISLSEGFYTQYLEGKETKGVPEYFFPDPSALKVINFPENCAIFTA